jgi:uncharacterized protein YbjQ (UPF0145 family)
MTTTKAAQPSTVKEVKRFVIAKAMIGKNITLKFVNKKGQLVEYNHDKVYEQLKDRFEAMPCFAKYKNYTNTNDLPVFVRQLKEIV